MLARLMKKMEDLKILQQGTRTLEDLNRLHNFAEIEDPRAEVDCANE